MSNMVAVVLVALALGALGRKPSGQDAGVWILLIILAMAHDLVRIIRKT